MAFRVIAAIDVSTKISSLCFQYSPGVTNDIEGFERKVSNMKDIFGQVKQLLDGRDQTLDSAVHTLSDSLQECLQQLLEPKSQLEFGNTRKAVKKFGYQVSQWPFTSREVEKHIASLESYKQLYTLALLTGKTGIRQVVSQEINLVDRKIVFLKLPVAKGASFDLCIEEHVGFDPC